MGELIVQTQARGLQLQTMQDYLAFGKMAADSSFVPKEFRGRPADCTLAAQYGAEIGLGPIQSLQCIAVVNGRPTVWGDTAMALVRSSGLCAGVEEGVEGTGDERAGFCNVQRKGETPQRRRFSVADAKRAKLWGRTGPWTDYPDRMLQLRARGFALRDVFPDVLRGLVTAEEAQDYRVTEPVVVRPAFPEPAAPEADEWQTFKATAPAAAAEPAAEPAKRGGATAGRLVAKAKAAVEKAADLAALDEVRTKIGEHLDAGRLDEAQAGELVRLCLAKADVLLANEEQAAAEESQEPAPAPVPF